MQIQIKNIWTVKNATINLDGLSVIAWSNDTWKSTVSKLIFSVIKAFQKYEEFSEVSKENIINVEIEKLYRHTRTIGLLLSDKKYEVFNVKNSWDILSILKKELTPDLFIEWLESDGTVNFFKEKKKKIEKLKFSETLKEDLFLWLKKIENEYFIDETKEYLVKNSLNVILKSEFKWQLNNDNKKWEINISDWDVSLINIDIKNNNVSNVQIYDDIIKIKDSTFTETPIFLNLFNDLDDISGFQYHFQDLFKNKRY